MITHFDVIIVGAGISGVGAAYHLQRSLPGKSFALLEGRDGIGGTWDLFRYPGIRSDSDMYTLGFPWRPWRHSKLIADGASIKQYVEDSAHEQGIDNKVRFGTRVRRVSWSSEHNRWTLECESSRGPLRYSCGFLLMCAGYYRYETAYTPHFAGMREFAGRLVHPQFWSDDIDYAGKRVVVIGSGATAVTLVPALAEKAAHVTMLQRSPSYVFSAPAEDPVAKLLRSYLPEHVAYLVTRWISIVLSSAFYKLTRTWPKIANKMLIDLVQEALGTNIDVSKHFTPRYNVWDQRVCLIPDGDLFQALLGEHASVVTEEIERFTRDGIKLKNGQELAADLIVTATGIELQMLGGIEVEVDGKRVDINQSVLYKSCMFSDVPNLATFFGYINASWTLKADMTARWLCRLLKHMDENDVQRCVPRVSDPAMATRPMLELTSGYIQRALSRLPQQGTKWPFKLYQNYLPDRFLTSFSKIDDGILELTHVQPSASRGQSSYSTSCYETEN
ncbi:MAG TPA: NAD(P)/FAD-dependent oxidoreductase [Polyangiales bacterium]|nr:NAD(P)/FAD-dependent oxidoreductase [Polyangiales bacterium]